MKKIVGIILLSSLSLFAVDQSVGNNKGIDTKQDTTMGYSKNLNINKEKTKSEDKSNVKETSLTNSKDLKRIEQTTSLIGLMGLEIAGIEPFASCGILTKPRLQADFGLDCETSSQTGLGFNEGKCSALSLAATNNRKLKSVVKRSNTKKVLEYATCSALYGALIAQDMKRDKFSVELTDPELLKTFKLFTNTLDINSCRLNQSVNNIVCGETQFKIDYTPNLSFGNITLYSDNTYFGYSASESVNKSKRIADSFTLSDSKKKTNANSMAKSLSTNKSMSESVSKSAQNNMSLSKFLPGE